MQKIKNVIKHTIYRFQFGIIAIFSLTALNEWLEKIIDNWWILLILIILYLLICQFIVEKIWGDNE
jgi:TRAP-type C4-dicarboxylate transport system permease large subunit